MLYCVLTGANRGIGAALARQILEEGHHLIASFRDPSSSTELFALAERHPDRCELLPLDVQSDESILEFSCSIAESFPKIDVLLNNAGVKLDADALGSIDRSAIHTNFDVNVCGPLLLTQALLPLLSVSPSLVVHISSVVGSIERARPNSGLHNYAYCPSKAALNMVGKLMANELASSDIGVLLLHPGWVRTRMGGEEAPLQTSESAAKLLRLIQSYSPEMSGSFLDPDGNPIPW